MNYFILRSAARPLIVAALMLTAASHSSASTVTARRTPTPAPTVTGGVLDIDLLLTRASEPLERAVQRFLDLADARPHGDDQALNIR